MQVQASIDEADIGQIHKGQKAKFSVDAYPNRQYEGLVSQIRLQPTTVQNVVTYTVMIDLENPDLSLLPGMTANITVEVQNAHDVFKVAAAALKFVPPGFQSAGGKRGGGPGDSASGAGQWKHAEGGGGKNAGNDDRKNWGRIFVLDNGKPVRIPVHIGLSNGGFTAIEGDVLEGQAVIIGLSSSNTKQAAQAAAPFGMQGPPGGGMGRMR